MWYVTYYKYHCNMVNKEHLKYLISYVYFLLLVWNISKGRFCTGNDKCKVSVKQELWKHGGQYHGNRGRAYFNVHYFGNLWCLNFQKAESWDLGSRTSFFENSVNFWWIFICLWFKLIFKKSLLFICEWTVHDLIVA